MEASAHRCRVKGANPTRHLLVVQSCGFHDRMRPRCVRAAVMPGPWLSAGVARGTYAHEGTIFRVMVMLHTLTSVWVTHGYAFVTLQEGPCNTSIVVYELRAETHWRSWFWGRGRGVGSPGTHRRPPCAPWEGRRTCSPPLTANPKRTGGRGAGEEALTERP